MSKHYAVEASPKFKEIMNLYLNRGDKSIQDVYNEVQRIDHNIARASFYRWTKKRETEIRELQNRVTEEVSIEKIGEQIDKKRLLKLAVNLGLNALQDPKTLREISQREKIKIALEATRILQGEEQLIMGDIHHVEEVDLKKEMMMQAAKPQIIIEQRDGDSSSD